MCRAFIDRFASRSALSKGFVASDTLFPSWIILKKTKRTFEGFLSMQDNYVDAHEQN